MLNLLQTGSGCLCVGMQDIDVIFKCAEEHIERIYLIYIMKCEISRSLSSIKPFPAYKILKHLNPISHT